MQRIDNDINYQMYLPLSLFSLGSCLLPRIRRTCIEPIKITSVDVHRIIVIIIISIIINLVII